MFHGLATELELLGLGLLLTALGLLLAILSVVLKDRDS